VDGLDHVLDDTKRAVLIEVDRGLVIHAVPTR
jgi:hypothetical protein